MSCAIFRTGLRAHIVLAGARGHCDGDPSYKQSLAPIVVQLVPSDQGTRCSSLLLCTLNDLNNAEVLNVFHVNVAVCSECIFVASVIFILSPPN
ncbi:unnamed protein product [Boreogadus saida]